MKVEFKKLKGLLFGLPAWTLEDDKVLIKNKEYYINKMYNIKSMPAGSSCYAIVFNYEEVYKPLFLYYDNDDKSKGEEAYNYIINKNGHREKYILNDFGNLFVVSSEGVLYNGEKIEYANLTKFEQNLICINGSLGSFTTKYNSKTIEIKYKADKDVIAKAAIALANSKIESYNKYHNVERANEFICKAIQNNNNPYSCYGETKHYPGLEDNIRNLIKKYENEAKAIVNENDNDISKSIEEFEKKNEVDNVIANYFVHNYFKKIEDNKKIQQHKDRINYAKEQLVENNGDKFITIKEVKAKFNLSTDEANDYVNKAISSLEPNSDDNVRASSSSSDFYSHVSQHRESPKCPHCGSSSFRRISTTAKVISTGFLGLASSSIGKTYICNKCGYKW